MHYSTDLVMGVRGAAVRHITTSLTAMFTTNSDMPVCRGGFLVTGEKGIIFFNHKALIIFSIGGDSMYCVCLSCIIIIYKNDTDLQII